MKIVFAKKYGNDMHHGIKYTEHDGSAGTSDNRMSYKSAVTLETYRNFKRGSGEQYQIEINGKNDGTIYTA